jgi:hypothetical protein
VLRPPFQRVFGDGAMVDEWFGETILYSESATLTNTFAPFGQLGAGVLRMLGRIHDVSISEADVAELSKGLASLLPHPDVPDSLRKLKRLSPGHPDGLAGHTRSRTSAGGGLRGPFRAAVHRRDGAPVQAPARPIRWSPRRWGRSYPSCA